MEENFDKTKLILPGAILISAILVSGSVLFYGMSLRLGANVKQAGGVPAKVAVSVGNGPILGSDKAKVTIVEFSDFQCPFCRAFWSDTLGSLKKEYIDTGKVRIVYRNFPLQFHPMSHPSAEAGGCAKDQGKFWEMHDKIFSEQTKQGSGTIQYSVNDLKKWASQIGLDANTFNQCLDSGKYKAEVDKDLADGNTYGVSGTPTFYVNGKVLVGAQPIGAFRAAIDAELK